MKSQIIKTIIVGWMGLVVLFFVPLQAQAINLKDAFSFEGENAPLKEVADTAGYATENGSEQLDLMVAKIVRAVLGFLGVIFLALIIYGGFVWMLARGNEQEYERAKKILSYAVVGIIIVVSAYAISYYVVVRLQGGTLQTTSETSS